MRSSQQSTQEREELGNLRVALAATMRCTRAVMHATNVNLLMEQVCAIVVDAGYLCCWIGAAEQDEKKTVRPLAWAGCSNGYLSGMRATWSDSELDPGPAGKAIRTAKPVVFQNLAGSPDCSPDHYGQFASNITLLEKPFTKTSLLKKVRSILDS